MLFAVLQMLVGRVQQHITVLLYQIIPAHPHSLNHAELEAALQFLAIVYQANEASQVFSLINSICARSSSSYQEYRLKHQPAYGTYLPDRWEARRFDEFIAPLCSSCKRNTSFIEDNTLQIWVIILPFGAGCSVHGVLQRRGEQR